MPDSRLFGDVRLIDTKENKKFKLIKYKELKKRYKNKEINWNTYCKLSKKYYQSPSELAIYGIK